MAGWISFFLRLQVLREVSCFFFFLFLFFLTWLDILLLSVGIYWVHLVSSCEHSDIMMPSCHQYKWKYDDTIFMKTWSKSVSCWVWCVSGWSRWSRLCLPHQTWARLVVIWKRFGDDNHLRILVVVMIRCALCMVLLVVVMAAVQYFSVIYCNWTTN